MAAGAFGEQIAVLDMMITSCAGARMMNPQLFMFYNMITLKNKKCKSLFLIVQLHQKRMYKLLHIKQKVNYIKELLAL